MFEEPCPPSSWPCYDCVRVAESWASFWAGVWLLESERWVCPSALSCLGPTTWPLFPVPWGALTILEKSSEAMDGHLRAVHGKVMLSKNSLCAPEQKSHVVQNQSLCSREKTEFRYEEGRQFITPRLRKLQQANASKTAKLQAYRSKRLRTS